MIFLDITRIIYASIVSFVKELCILHQVFDQCICLIKLLLNSRHSQVLTGLTSIPDIYPPFSHQLSFKKQTSDISHGTQVLLPSPPPTKIKFHLNLNLTCHGIHWHPGRICRSKVTNKNYTAGNPPNPKHHNVGFPYFPASSNDLPLGVGFQVFGPYCFNSFAWVFPTCEASDCREIAGYCGRCG